MHVELPFASVLTTLLLVVPCAHWASRRRHALCALAAWLAIVSFVFAVDAIVWAGNVKLLIPLWCDLTAKLITASQLALPACCFCVCFELHGQLKPPETRSLPRSLKVSMILKLATFVGLPFTYAALSCFFQIRRFDIIEDIGCRSAYINASPTLVIVSLPPIFVCISAIGLALMILAPFRRSHSDVRKWDMEGRRKDVYLAGATAAWLLTVGVVRIIITLKEGLEPWPGVTAAHKTLSMVAVFSAASSSPSQRAAAFFDWWNVLITAAVVLFITFLDGAFFSLVAVKVMKRSGHSAYASSDSETATDSMTSEETTISSSAGTIRFGRGSDDFFTVPKYDQPAEGRTRTLPLVAEGSAELAEVPRKPSLPSFLPIDEEDEEEATRKGSAGQLSVFTTSDFPLPPDLVSAPPVPSPPLPSRAPSLRSRTSAPAPPAAPSRGPSLVRPTSRTPSFGRSMPRTLSQQSSCRTPRGVRHISISSAFVETFGEVPPTPAAGSLPALPPPPPVARSPGRARFALPFFERRARAPLPPRSEYELELSIAPAACTNGVPDEGEVYFMVPVKH